MSKPISVATFQLDELLKQVNDSVAPSATLTEILKGNPFIRTYLTCLIDPNWVEFDVNDIKWTNFEYGSSALLLNRHTAHIFQNIIYNEKVALKTKKFQCKTLLETLCKGEADVLVALLKKDIQPLYPNITFDILTASL